MPLQEHCMFAQVLYLNDKPAPFRHLRIDVESKNRAGDTVVRPLVILNYDSSKKDPYLVHYTLKNPNAALWLVLVDENGESKKKISPNQHRYVFRNESETSLDELRLGQEDRSEPEPKVVNIINYFNKKENMARTA